MKPIVESYQNYHLIKEGNEELLAKSKIKLSELESELTQLEKDIASYDVDIKKAEEKIKELDKEIKDYNSFINKVKSKSGQAWGALANAQSEARYKTPNGESLKGHEMRSLLQDYGIEGTEANEFMKAKSHLKKLNTLISDRFNLLNSKKEYETAINKAQSKLSTLPGKISTEKNNIQKYSQTELF